MKTFLTTLTLGVSAMLSQPSLADIAVYPGCTAPPASTGQTWYIDAINGKTAAAGGLGTQMAPWNSLKAVVGTKGAIYAGTFGPDVGYAHPLLSTVKGSVGPVHPGDTINLMSGDYGDVAIGDYNMKVVNPDWVTVQAAPGQTPVLTSLAVARTNKWVFDGLKVQSTQLGHVGALVTVGDQGAAYPTSDIVFTNMDMSTFDTIPDDFTQANWIAQGRTGFVEFGSPGTGKNGVPYTRCVSMTNSHIHNVGFGAAVMGNESLFSHNEIDHFGNDALDFGANNLAITQNKVHDAFGLANGIHNDAMQGQNGPLARGVPFNYFSNILIDSNIIIRQLDPNLKFPTYLQGIDAYDEDWTNITVTNNVLISSNCHGVTFSSIHDSLIAGNTVIADGQIATPGCSGNSIQVGNKTHQGPSSTNTRVTNNLATEFVFNAPGDTNITMDNNTALRAQGFVWYDAVAKSYVFYKLPPAATGNTAPLAAAGGTKETDVFENWSPSTYVYDLHIKASSPTMNRGTGVPMGNIENKLRVPPLSPGAY